MSELARYIQVAKQCAMARNRRRNGKQPTGNVETILNREQLSALLKSQQFGWRLWFIRKPVFPDSLPVLYNVTNNRFAVLEPDGHINPDVKINIRADRNSRGDLKLVLPLAKSAAPVDRSERRSKLAPAREKLEALLSRHQLRALREMESSGWRLLFVRTSLFQAPEIVITNSEGDVVGTLEHDGQLNLTPDLAVREGDRLE
jgi:hypothetical protein